MTSYRGFSCLEDWTFQNGYATCDKMYFDRNPEKENILSNKTLEECQTTCTNNNLCKAMHHNSEKQECTIYTHTAHEPFVFSFHDSHAHVFGIRDCEKNYSKQECLSIDNATEITDITLPTGCIRTQNITYWNNETSDTTHSFTNKPQNITCPITTNATFSSKVPFKIVSNDTCESNGMESIYSSDECQQAYNYLRNKGSTMVSYSSLSGGDSRCFKTGQAATFSPLLQTYNESFSSLYTEQSASSSPDSDTSHHYKCDGNEVEALLGDKGDGYVGFQNKTRDGLTCQNWTEQTPHKHTISTSDKGIGNHNYCRNPDGEDTIWCYTTDSKTRWGYCDPLGYTQEAIENACNADDECKGYTIESTIENDISFTQFSGPDLNGANVSGNCRWPLTQTFWETGDYTVGTTNCKSDCESSDDCAAYVQADKWCVIYNKCRIDSSGNNWGGKYFTKVSTPMTVLKPRCLVTDTSKNEAHKLYIKPSPSFCGTDNPCICKWYTGATENQASDQNVCENICDSEASCNGFSYDLYRGCETYTECSDEENASWESSTIWKHKVFDTTFNKDLECGVNDSKCLCKNVSLVANDNFVAKIKI